MQNAATEMNNEDKESETMYHIVATKNWEEARAIGNLLQRHLWVFRGQTKASWPLESKLYREALKRSLESTTGALGVHETWALLEFQRAAHHYASQVPGETAYLDWLTLMRHYG